MLCNKAKIDQYNKVIESLYSVLLGKIMKQSEEIAGRDTQEIQQLAGKVVKSLVYSYARQSSFQDPQEWIESRTVLIKSASGTRKDLDVVVI